MLTLALEWLLTWKLSLRETSWSQSHLIFFCFSLPPIMIRCPLLRHKGLCLPCQAPACHNHSPDFTALSQHLLIHSDKFYTIKATRFHCCVSLVTHFTVFMVLLAQNVIPVLCFVNQLQVNSVKRKNIFKAVKFGEVSIFVFVSFSAFVWEAWRWSQICSLFALQCNFEESFM